MWSSNLAIQRLLVIAMFCTVDWAFVRMLLSMGLALPEALSTGLLALVVFSAGLSLGGRETGRNYRRYTEYGFVDWVLLLVPIVLILKLLPRLLEGPGSLAAEVASWMDEPWRFWDVTLVWSILLIFLVWDYSVRVGEELGNLAFQPGEAPEPDETRRFESWEQSPYRFIRHAAAWRRLMWSFAGGGFAVIVFSGLTIVSPAELGNPNRAEVGGIIPSVLLYYVLGLILASQTSLDRLRAEWLRVGATIQPGLARRWLGYGLVLMVAALLLATLLPTSFTARAVDELPAGWGILWYITWPLRVVLGAFFGLLGWIFAHIAAILFAPIAGLLPAGPGSPPAAPAPQTAPPADPTGGTGGYPSLASRLVWFFLLYALPFAIAAYAIWNTWRKRHMLWRGVRAAVRDVPAFIWGAILDLVAVLWRFFSAGSPRLLNFAPAEIKKRWRRRRRTSEVARTGWLRLRGLGPRALIQYFYISLLQRAEALGWSRSSGQTPYEYSNQLAQQLPDRREEVHALTEAFVNAKYSRRPVDDDDARRARGPWERIRGALQTRRRTQQLASWFGLGRGDG